jgi:regulator of protease activity HflC (stomatin/prohibitin superfamily)
MSPKKREITHVKETPKSQYVTSLVKPYNYTDDMSLEIKRVTVEIFKTEVVRRSKSLYQILDEYDENIRAAAEASRRAELAAKAAKEAAGQATKASAEAEKRAEEAGISGLLASKTAIKAATKAEVQFKKATGEINASNAALFQRIKILEDRLAKVETTLPDEKVIVVRQISKKEAEKEIADLFSKGKTLYYSDIVECLNLDLELVVDICNKLQKRGEIKIDDNALQSR